MTATSGTYAISDALTEFRIRVNLERIDSLIGIIPFPTSTTHGTTTLEEGQDAPPPPVITATTPDSEEFIFKWQQKIFGPRERALYAMPIHWETPREQRYSQELAEMRSKQTEFPTRRLFSYIEGDIIPETIRSLTNEHRDRNSSGMLNCIETAIRQHDVAPHSRRNDPIAPLPSAELCRRSRTIRSSSQTMHIMAYLGAIDNRENMNFDISEEKVICTIRIINDRIMIVDPDFNSRPRKPYRLHGHDGLYSVVFGCDDVSAQFGYSDVFGGQFHPAQQMARLRSLKSRDMKYDDEEETFKMAVFAVIERAWNFENDGLYCEYLLHLPDGWSAEPPSVLNGISQICYCSADDVAVFSYPFESILCYKSNGLKDQNREIMMMKWPSLSISIRSVDHCGVHRQEGYAHMPLPYSTGTIAANVVRCWRPMQSTPSSALQRFFVGGCLELESLKHIALPSNGEISCLSKANMITTDAGNVSISFNIAHEWRSNSSIHELEDIQSQADSAIDRLLLEGTKSIGGMPWTIVAILEAFEQAKQRMTFTRDQFFFNATTYGHHR